MDSSKEAIPNPGECHNHDTEAVPAGRPGRKRVSREPAKLDDSAIFDDSFELNDDGRPKTRRVNPQRLAIRLGPELVAEMEALIVPGAKMPTFAVRKDFQERYCVDRRHIYDYFHSRGLRVSKEDKHTNLIRGRAAKAAAAAAAAAAATSSPALLPPSEKDKPSLPAPSTSNAPLEPASGPVRTKATKPPRKRKVVDAVPKARRTFLVPATQDTSRESTLSPTLEPNRYSQPSMDRDWAAKDISESTISDVHSMISTPPQESPDFNVIAKSEFLDLGLPDLPPMDNTLGSLLASQMASGALDHEGLLPYQDSFGDALTNDEWPPYFDKSERAAIYDAVQNSLHLGLTAGPIESSMKYWPNSSGKPTVGSSLHRPSYGQENNFGQVYSRHGETHAEQPFDIRGWLSEDMAREESNFPTGTRPSTVSSGPTGGGTRSVYLGRYDGGFPEYGLSYPTSREIVFHSRAQGRPRTASARGEI